MSCKICKGNVWYCVPNIDPLQIIKTCYDCKQKLRISRETENVYRDAVRFMDNESRIQFESDYPDDMSFLKANGLWNI